MGKVFAVLLIVLGIWVGLELMNNGSDGAFGGLLVKTGLVEKSDSPAAPATRRAVESVDRAYRAGENRVDRQLDPAP